MVKKKACGFVTEYTCSQVTSADAWRSKKSCTSNAGSRAPPQTDWARIFHINTLPRQFKCTLQVEKLLRRGHPEIEDIFSSCSQIKRLEFFVSLTTDVLLVYHLIISDTMFKTSYYSVCNIFWIISGWKPQRKDAWSGHFPRVVGYREISWHLQPRLSGKCSILTAPAHRLCKLTRLSSRIKILTALTTFGPCPLKHTQMQSVQRCSQWAIVEKAKPESEQVRPSQVLIIRWEVKTTTFIWFQNVIHNSTANLPSSLYSVTVLF